MRRFLPAAILCLFAVTIPAAHASIFCKGDVNRDSNVNGADIEHFLDVYINGIGPNPDFYDEAPSIMADMNDDGVLTFADIGLFASCLVDASSSAACGVCINPLERDGIDIETEHRIFVTSQTFQGDFGGLAFADCACNQAAQVAGLELEYRAILSDSVTSAASRIALNAGPLMVFKDIGGGNLQPFVVLNNATNLWSGATGHPLLTTISYDPDGAVVGTSAPVWTGSTVSGEIASENCVGWSVSDFLIFGRSGNPANPTLWVSSTGRDCDIGGRFYCISQFPGSGDCNANGISDACDIANCAPGDPTCADLNRNQAPDACDPPLQLVGHWLLDENMGTIAGDISGNNLDGDLIGSVTWTPGQFNSGLLFDNTVDYVHIPHDPVLDVSDSFSLAFWVNGDPAVQGAPGDIATLIDKSHGLGDENGWAVQARSNEAGAISIAVGTGSSFPEPRIAGVLDNSWHHVAITVSVVPHLNIRGYLDGDLVTNFNDSANTIANSPGDLLFGAWHGVGNPQRQFDGRLDEVRFYTGLLRPCDIEDLVGNGGPIDCNGNGVADGCDIAIIDCNTNAIPDDCELAGNDCNANGVPDDCELTELNAIITTENESTNDGFGRAMSLDGDTLIVGAPFDDEFGTNAGAAYVFVRTAGIWAQQAKLTANDASLGVIFGNSVSISGDTAVIGSYRDDDAGTDSGSAYIFQRTGSVWTQQAKLTASDAAVGDFFGISVAISGNTVVIGAQHDDDAGSNSGSAYVFTRTGTLWAQQAKLTANDASLGVIFGNSVSISGDTIIVGCYRDDDAGTDSGSAYIFQHAVGVWSQQAKLTANDAAVGDIFGISVAISGDTVVIGASGDDDDGLDSGSAYIFQRMEGVWSQEAKLSTISATDEQYFGNHVSMYGDIVSISAAPADSFLFGGGSAYLFGRSGTSWIQRAKLETDVVENIFGENDLIPVAISLDTVIIGGLEVDTAVPTTQGATYIYAILDCDLNGIPNECQLTGNDCNANSIPDSCELLGNDCNSNSSPDDCELSGNDCNVNGIPDECDVAETDCNANGIPDDCDIADCPMGDASCADANNNGVPDGCEPAPGLVGHWPLDEDMGAIAGDVSGNQLDGDLVGSVGWTPGQFNSGLIFDNSVDYVLIPHDPILDVSDAFSLSFWINAGPQPLASIIDKSHSLGGTNGWTAQATGSGALLFAVGTGSGFPEPSIPGVLDNSWHHVAINVSLEPNLHIRGYVDGTLVTDFSDPATTLANNSGALFFGAWHGNGNPQRQFIGKLDEVRFYNVALSECEIEALSDPTGATDCNGNGLPDNCDLIPSTTGSTAAAANDVPVFVPDIEIEGATSTITIAETGIVTDIDLTMSFDHTDIRDLEISLEHDGLTVGVATILCLFDSMPIEDLSITIDDDAAEFLPSVGCASPLTGTFQPNSFPSISEFTGTSMAGDWTLIVTDAFPSGSGSLTAWSINVQYGDTPAFSGDANGNGIPDECEDCNGNGVPDFEDVDPADPDGDGFVFADCNSNNLPDGCDIDPADPDENGSVSLDCNLNQIPDECDVDPADPDGNGTSSADCDNDGIPNECELMGNDCNVDMTPDNCQLVGADCDSNGILDECELAANDCNGNFVLDACELLYRASDSTAEEAIGFPTVNAQMVWLAEFETVSGATVIDAIEVAFANVPSSVPASVFVWSDPNQDGNPSDALILASGSIVTASPGSSTFISADVPDVDFGSEGVGFFAGVVFDVFAGEFPAALDQTSTRQRSWIAFDASEPFTLDPANLAGVDNPPVLIDSLNFPGNWLLAVTPKNDCNANGTLDECDIADCPMGDASCADANNNGVPDGCEPGPQLIGHWTFDENMGTTAADSSGNGLDGTLIGAVDWTPAQINSGLLFDNSVEYVEVAHDPILDIADEFAVAFWINAGPQPLSSFIDKSHGGDLKGWTVEATGSGNILVAVGTGTGFPEPAIPGALDNTWHHVAVNVSLEPNLHIRGYVDGALVTDFSDPATTIANNSRSLLFGTWFGGVSGSGPARQFEGALDDIRVYSDVLRICDIETLADPLNSPGCP